jgi:hypothetical protein
MRLFTSTPWFHLGWPDRPGWVDRNCFLNDAIPWIYPCGLTRILKKGHRSLPGEVGAGATAFNNYP